MAYASPHDGRAQASALEIRSYTRLNCNASHQLSLSLPSLGFYEYFVPTLSHLTLAACSQLGASCEFGAVPSGFLAANLWNRSAYDDLLQRATPTAHQLPFRFRNPSQPNPPGSRRENTLDTRHQPMCTSSAGCDFLQYV